MLVSFKEQINASGGDDAANQPPFVLRASDLDKNFALCHPLVIGGNNAPYTIERPGNDGFILKGAAVFDVCENGKPVKYRFFAAKESTQQG
jgi:hypothetical protein